MGAGLAYELLLCRRIKVVVTVTVIVIFVRPSEEHHSLDLDLAFSPGASRARRMTTRASTRYLLQGVSFYLLFLLLIVAGVL